MPLPDLITLGEAFEDLIFLDLPRLPAPGEEIKTARFARTVGGGAVITAVAAARLGVSCRVVSGLGEAGEARVAAEGVCVTNLRRRGEPAALSAALSTRDNRTFVTFNGMNDALEGRLLRAVPALRARHVHLALQPRRCRPWRAAVTGLRRRGITCSWDFGWSEALLDDPHFVPLLDALDLLFLNEQEAVLYARRPTLDAALETWRDRAAEVVVKLGPRGSCVVAPQGAIARVAAPSVRAVDTTGAGDAFNGGFLVARLRRQATTDALALGNFVGSRSTRAPGGLDGLPAAADVPPGWRRNPPCGPPRHAAAFDGSRAMKLAVIGGAGVRTPLLVSGLTRSDLPIRHIALYDPDQARLEVVGDLARRVAADVRVTTSTTSADAIAGADFVFISIRVGGIAARARDEAAALDRGLVGQETVGPAGFAMAMRTIPPMVAYAREVAELAPRAWIINFTNPVGIVTQAVRTATGARIIGICDTPTETYEEVCHALDLPADECFVDYFGLNHLGWVREVYHHGVPQLHRIWEDPARLARVYRTPLFPLDLLRELRLLPTEYVYFYYLSERAVENTKRAGHSRGEVIAGLNEQLMADLAAARQDPVKVYEAYLAARDAGYMQIESGSREPRAKSPWAEVTGYDRIALNTVRAIHFNTGAVIPLNVENRGNIPELQDQDVVEVPCVVTANGARPVHVGHVAEQTHALISDVKAYERLTVAASLEGGGDRARRALASNPLVPSDETAGALLASLALP
ncbi:MAG: PfkB family carbohydrate kinase [Vicinamibacterales bacterium]